MDFFVGGRPFQRLQNFILVIVFILFFPNQIAKSQSLKVAVSKPYKTEHPFLWFFSPEKNFQRNLLLPPLMEKSPQWNCPMCASLDVLPSREGGMVTKISLKKHLTWGDHQPLTIQDLFFTFQTAIKIRSIVPLPFPWSEVLEVKLQGHFCHVTWRRKLPAFFYLRHVRLIPKHREPFKKSKDYLEKSSYVLRPRDPGLYYGSHIFQENQNFISRKSKKPSMEFFVASPKEIWESEVKIPTETLLSYKILPNFSKKLEDSLFLEHITMNTRSPILKDKRVRQALAYGISMTHMEEALSPLPIVPAYRIFHPTDSLALGLDPKPYFYDPTEAQRLLDETGWTLKKGEGPWRKKHDKVLELTLETTQEPWRIAQAKTLKRLWENLGVRIFLSTYPKEIFLKERFPKIQFSHMALLSWYLEEEFDPSLISLPNFIPVKKNSYTGGNTAAWFHPHVKTLCHKITSTYNSEERTQLWHEWQKLIHEEVPYIPLWFHTWVVR